MSSMVEDILGGALGQAGLGGGKSGGSGGVMGMLQPAVSGMLENGGLSNVLGNMKAEGMGAEADSWVGQGENLPISPDQAKRAVGSEQVKALADRAGISEDQAAGVLAGALPQLADEASPEGRLPDAAAVDDAMRKPRRKRAQREGQAMRQPRAGEGRRAGEAVRQPRDKGAKRGGDAARRPRGEGRGAGPGRRRRG
jgi:uncharacterized protein YidB (DUF937 family)